MLHNRHPHNIHPNLLRLNNGYECIKTKKERRDNTFTTLISDTGQFYSIEIFFETQNKKHINKVTIYDSLKILNKHNKKLQEQRVPRIGKTLNEIKNEQFQKMQEKKKKTITIKKLITSIIIIIVSI